MSLSDLLADLLDHGVQLWVERGRLRFRTRGGALPAELAGELERRKGEVLERIGEDRKLAPASFAQQRLWFLEELEPAARFTVHSAWRLGGGPDPALLEKSLREIVRRHESLRTSIEGLAGRPFQVVRLGSVGFESALGDLSALPPERGEAEARRLCARQARRAFDLARGPLFRSLVLRLGEGGILQVTLHHAIADGWSLEVFERELAALYEGFADGRAAVLPPLPGQYADFAVWQRGRLAGEVLESQLAFWKAALGPDPPALELPADRPRSAAAARRAGVATLEIAAPLGGALAALGAAAGGSLFMTLLAGFAALLGRLAGRGGVRLGIPVANRGRAELEPLIGLFVNTLVIPVDLAPRSGFRALLERVRETVLQALAHQDLPFEKLVEALRPERELDRTPLFQVLFNMFNFTARERAARRPGGLALEPCYAFDNVEAHYDLALYAAETAASVRLDLVYRADLFDRSRVRRMLDSFAVLLEAVTAGPRRPLAEIPFSSRAERHQLLFEWSAAGAVDAAPALPAPAGAPDAVAVTFERPGLPEVRVTYRELCRRIDRLARRLRRSGVGAESLVGLRLGRSPRLVEAVLAVWKAGGAYVPLDPGYPEQRLEWMQADSRPGVVLRDTAEGADFVGQIPPTPLSQRGAKSSGLTPVPPFEKGGLGGISRQTKSAGTPAEGDHLAYAIYTSGSTGRPKGVLVSRGSLATYLRSIADLYALTPSDAVLQVASMSFDVSVRELIAPLQAGARLVLVDDEAARDPAALSRVLERQRVTCLLGLVPSLLRAMLEAGGRPFAGLRLLAFAGEALPLADVGRLREVPGFRARVVNQYGPTEGTGTSCAFAVGARDGGRGIAPIGRPHAHVAVYVLDRSLRPVPAGAAGELCLAGAGLARGYLNRPALTAEKLVPFAAGGRLYRTGDLVRYRGDGRLEILGRADQQVKVRGIRVEPGEVEAALARHPAVREAAVAARESRLTAWYVRRGAAVPRAGELRAFLARELPEPMVPSVFRAVEELPKTSSGKVDRRALALLAGEAARLAPGESAGGACPARRAASPVQEILVEIWSRVLATGPVGIDDDFFDLGGHSLLATRVLSRVRNTFGVELALRALFEGPTVALLARRVEAALSIAAGEATALAPVPRDGELPLSFGQLRLWFLHRLEPASSAYNLPAAWRLEGDLDAAALAASLTEIRRRHEVLRTTFPSSDGRPRQAISGDPRFDLPEVDLTAIPAASRVAEERRVVTREENRPFDAAQGSLARAILLRTGDREHVFLYVADHMVSDGGSYGLFCRELGELYRAARAGRPSPLSPLPIQYADFAAWQRARLEGEALGSLLGYWRRRLDGVSELRLPADRPRRAERRAVGAVRASGVPAGVALGLGKLSRAAGATLFMTSLAAFMALLFRLTGQRDLAVGTPVANRRREETEELIGFFVDTIVIRGDLGGSPRFSELVARIREAALGAYSHQDLPFERLVEELRPVRDPSRHPVFQAMFMLWSSPREAELELEGLEVVPLERSPGEARFDVDLTLRADGDALRGAWVYASDLFDATTAARWAGHFGNVLAAVAGGADLLLEELPLLGPAERHHLVVESNDTRTVVAEPRGVLGLFEDRAAAAPDSVAVVSADAHLSYRELDGRARRLASRLLRRGAGPEARVAVSVGRSPELAVSLLAVLRAGAAFVPMDPAWPGERRRLMADDCGASAVLTRDALDALGLEGEGRALPPPRELAESLAYVIYTSGSTGAPKGVMVARSALANCIASTIAGWGVGPGDRVLQLASVGFDAGVQDVFAALASGACLVLPGPGAPPSARELAETLDAQRVSVANPPTSFWHEWVDALEAGAAEPPGALRRVILGGEKVSGERVRAWRRRFGAGPVRLIDEYGPTECTVAATRADLTARAGGDPPGGDPPIGGPIDGVEAHVLDRAMSPVPIGAAGEIHVGGAGLARGYLGRPRRTAEAFVPDPLAARRGARLYKTGDMARRLAGGELVFLGRIDSQVKVRGFRVEPGEVEAVLARHPRLREAAVVARRDPPLLAAYLVPTDPAQTSSPGVVPELRAWLADRLPDFMIPSRFTVLEALPRTASGKVDRRALPAPDVGDPAAEARFVAPRTKDEEALAGIWSEVLGVERVGAGDDFFALGGHSLLAVRLIAVIERRLGVRLPLAVLLRHSTLEGLAARLRGSGEPAGRPPLLSAHAGGAGLPFFCVRPAGGHLQCYAELARRMAAERPFYTLQSNGSPRVLPALAAECLEAVLEVEPRRPLLLGGWSLGGVVAFEIARQARERGVDVALVALLDASDPRGLAEVPRPYSGAVTLFRPLERDRSEADPTRGWGALATEGVDLVDTPGDHHSMIRRPHVEVLARRLDRAIRASLGGR